MSKSRFCVVCHDTVWFGAYGNSEEHVFDSYYDARVCKSCIDRLQTLPIRKKGEYNEDD